MTEPLVSVVIPTYARPKRLKQAARSVIKQTHSQIELIVVDDHSPEPASEVLPAESIDEIEIVHIRHEENKGANAARNTGIRAASGEYIGLLDDDDEWVSTKIARQVEVFDENDDDVGVVYTACEYDFGEYTLERRFGNEGDVTKDILLGKGFGEFSTLMVRSDIIEKAGLPDEQFPSWQDREWLLRLSLHTKFKAIDELLTRRRCFEGEERISNNYTEKRDVSFPMMIDKHRDLAASYGRKYERAFIASLLYMLGQEALRLGHFSDARKHFVKSIYYYPLKPDRLLYMLASLGGKLSYFPARRLSQMLDSEKNLSD